jgi:Fe-S cluster biogenesis protein NfuA
VRRPERVGDPVAVAAPEELQDVVEEAMDGKVRQLVEAHGGGMEVEVDDAGTAHVTFRGRCANCPSAPVTMGALVRPALLRIPGVTQVTRRGATSRFAEERIAKMFDITPVERLGSP